MVRGGWKPTQQGQEESGVPHRVWEGSQGPPGGKGGVERAGRGRESLPEGQRGSGDPPIVPGRVGWPSRRSRSGQKDLSEVWE